MRSSNKRYALKRPKMTNPKKIEKRKLIFTIHVHLFDIPNTSLFFLYAIPFNTTSNGLPLFDTRKYGLSLW